MNGRVLFDFMYDQFVWPAHPFAGRDVRAANAEASWEPRDFTSAVDSDADASLTAGALAPPLSCDASALIVLADRRKKTT